MKRDKLDQAIINLLKKYEPLTAHAISKDETLIEVGLSVGVMSREGILGRLRKLRAQNIIEKTLLGWVRCCSQDIDPLSKDKGPAFRFFEAFCRDHLKVHQPRLYQEILPHLEELKKIYGVQEASVVCGPDFKQDYGRAFDLLWANSSGVEGEKHIDAMSAFVFCLSRENTAYRKREK